VLRLPKVLFSTLLAAVSALAQTPATPQVTPAGPTPAVPAPAPVPIPPRPAATLPGTPAAALPGTPGALAAAPNANGQEPLEQLQFPNTDVKDVLEFYSQRTRRKLIYSNQLVGSIYLSINNVTRSEAVKLIEMCLAMNGFYIIPSEDPTIWRVTGVGQNPKSVGVPFLDDEAQLPADDQVVMFLFKLKYQDPTELAQTLSQGVLVPNQGQFTSVVPLPKANALLVTETSSIIRTLIRVVRSIDEKPAEGHERVYHPYARAGGGRGNEPRKAV
jgi:type II secretory pathway component GspD/PulD (secretin)